MYRYIPAAVAAAMKAAENKNKVFICFQVARMAVLYFKELFLYGVEALAVNAVHRAYGKEGLRVNLLDVTEKEVQV